MTQVLSLNSEQVNSRMQARSTEYSRSKLMELHRRLQQVPFCLTLGLNMSSKLALVVTDLTGSTRR